MREGIFLTEAGMHIFSQFTELFPLFGSSCDEVWLLLKPSAFHLHHHNQHKSLTPPLNPLCRELTFEGTKWEKGKNMFKKVCVCVHNTMNWVLFAPHLHSFERSDNFQSKTTKSIRCAREQRGTNTEPVQLLLRPVWPQMMMSLFSKRINHPLVEAAKFNFISCNLGEDVCLLCDYMFVIDTGCIYEKIESY